MPPLPRPSRPALALALAGTLLAGCTDGGEDLSQAFADFASSDVGTSSGTAGAAPTEPVAAGAPGASPDTPRNVARALDALERLGAHALVGLARRLETGAPLDAVDRACLGDHDPALGAPLASLACAEPLAIGATPVAVRAVRLVSDPGCLAALGDASRGPADVVAGCDWERATVELRTEWTLAPPPADGGYAGTPRPLPAARFEYSSAPPALEATHLEPALTGELACRADPVAGTVDGDATCAASLAGFAARLERFADAADGPAPN